MFAWLTGSSGRKPLLLEVRSSKTLIIITVATAVFTDIFVYALIVPVFPFVLTERAGIEPDKVQTWISILLAVYGAALLIVSPFCGYLADRISSRRVPLLLGLIVLAASTVMLAIGNSIGILLAGRALQGASSAVVWVTGLALLVDTVGTNEVGQAMGYVGISLSLAVLLAPLLGGVVYAKAGYYAVFAMAFGLIAFDVFLRLVMIERKFLPKWQTAPELQAQPTDPDAITVVGGSTATEAAPNKDEEVAVEQPRTPRWMDKFPPVIRLCTSYRLLSALFAALINSTLLTSFDATLPIFVNTTFEWDSIGAGLIFLPLVLATFTGPLIGAIADQIGARWLMASGFVMGGPLLILLRFVTFNSLGQKVLLCALLALVGVTLTFVLTPMMAELAYIVAEKEKRAPAGFYGKNGAYAQAYSLFNMSWACGTFLGPLLAGLINSSSGFATAYLILGCISMAAAVPIVIFTGGNIFKLRRERAQAAASTA